jgi:uncharacterized membrane protein YesL
MIEALQVAKFSLRDLWDDLVLLVLLNLVWAVAAALPAVPFLLIGNWDSVLIWVVVAVLAVPLPIISGALCWVTNQIARGKAVGWGTFTAGLRQYWGKSLIVTAINLLVVVLIVANVQFYDAILEGSWTVFAVIAWGLVAAYWLLVQVFWFPMILELESEKVFVALRNALGMVLMTPWFTLSLAVILLLLTVVSALLPFMVLVLSIPLLFLIANHATRNRLAWAHKQPYERTELE